ncbi:MAG: prepilin peptidase [Deltaproteobacteria bacterium]|nr:prepilin peptidase [Deltaproteobacteria bacterium]
MREIEILYLLIFALGAVIGSFLNVCIHRIPEGKSIISPPSSCQNCSNSIRFYDNIPIISYLILRGKCRYCKTPISIQYPVVEILSGFFAVITLYYFGFSIDSFIYFTFIDSLIIIAFIDFKHQIIPDSISLPGIAIGFVCSFFLNDITPLDSFAGILIGGGSLFIFLYSYEKIRGIEGMGGGDIKLISMLGAFLGWKAVIVTIFTGSFIGAGIGIIAMLVHKKDTKYAMPFGPFLALGAVIYLFLGNDLVNWYINFWVE